ncbi:beta-1,3-galactosyltransferase 6 [Euwallacea fornicatus]|uniref:beta-1,3-galactosyltransferase 6 n=1 Tax=Euwallacea fornicatus TaxID=995702 RepID=UPI00338F0963
MRFKETRYFRSIILSFFFFSLGCMLTLNLTPIDKTCILDNEDREYHIMQNSKLKNPELIILIVSAPNNLERRNVIRRTWLKLGRKSAIPAGYKFKHYFVIGSLNLSTDQVLHMSAEQSSFADILILPINDSYENLTEKVLKSFTWLDEQFNYGLGYKYALKCDDDSFINLPELLKEIPKMENMLANSNLQFPLNLPPEKLNHFICVNVQSNVKTNKENFTANMSLYWGYFHGNAKIKTSGKWKETDWITCDRYAPYALGGGYILSKPLVSFIAKNTDYLRTFKSEDISVGLWLSPVTDVIRIHDIRFDTEWISRGCKNYYLISHPVGIDEMKEMYNSLISDKRLCVSEEERRKYYLYDWSVPPSHCCISAN